MLRVPDGLFLVGVLLLSGEYFVPSNELWILELLGIGAISIAAIAILLWQRQTSVLHQVTQELADTKQQYQSALAQMQAVLQERDQQFRWVLEHMPLMLHVFDANRVLQVWNQECERVTGYSAAEMVGNPQAMSLLYPDPAYREQMMAHWQEKGNNDCNWEWQVTCKDGSTKAIAWSNVANQVPVPGWAWWGMGTDVSPLKQARQEQQQALARFQTVFEQTLLVPIQGFDAQGIVHYWNEASTQLYDIAQAEALHQPIQKLLRLETAAGSFVATLQTIIATGATRMPSEHQLTLSSGKMVWIYSVIVPIWQDGEVTDFFCMDIDITDRKHSELQIRRLNEALETQNRHLESLVEQRTSELVTLINTLPDYIFVIEKDSMRLLFCNDLLAHITGAASRYEVQGKTIFECFSPERAAYFAAQNRSVFDTGNPLHLQETLDLPTGTIDVDTYKIPLKQPDGEVYALIGTSRNITEIVQARQALAERSQQLEAANHELELFSYSISHDLRAPLRHINGFISALAKQLSQEEALQNSQTAHYLQVIEHSSQQMGLLIDGLLNLSRVGRQPLRHESIPIARLVQQAIQLVQWGPQGTPDVQFVVGELPTVTGDATLLQQVFSNLIDNAVKFSRSRKPARIDIGSLPNGTVYVKDNGVGFDMTYADQLFGAFQRLHPRSEFEGMGMGLAIVQRIMHRHQGTIWAESQPNAGTCFYLQFADSSPTVAL
ncbi:MAG: PAS domain S-box protein [Leptolyngbyaceae cyanobacterium bins.349]|nr:PAS domain S-box protein [Leptolyngbyaceae cyanobacterium bins.349]